MRPQGVNPCLTPFQESFKNFRSQNQDGLGRGLATVDSDDCDMHSNAYEDDTEYRRIAPEEGRQANRSLGKNGPGPAWP